MRARLSHLLERWADRLRPPVLDLSGLPTHECVCGSDTFKILARFEDRQIVWYTLTGYCYMCGAKVQVPCEADDDISIGA